jgi:tRNA(adenine34) deaminase
VSGDETLMREALRLAEEGLAAGDQPIGAIVALGDEVVSAARWTLRPGALLDHAEVVALRAADGDPRVRRRGEATLYTTLEPCLMCMGTAMSFLVGRVVYALEAPADGASEIADVWQPDLGHPPAGHPIYAVPEVVGGVCRDESLALASAFADQHPELGWARAFIPGFRYPSG